jgi:carboxyl-terminal processing protease
MVLNAITSAYDPHTNYLAPRAKENFDISMSGSLEGIGAVLQEDDHYISVLEIVPGGASWRQAKLEAGDLILAVAQEGELPVDVGDMPIGKVVQMVRGPKGTVVRLTVQKPTNDVETIAITRDVVKIETAYARGAVLSGGGHSRVGYIYLPSFYGNTRVEPGQTPERSCTDDVRLLLEELKRRGVKGVIVDLRGNGGGLLSDAQEMSGLFIERGPIVQTRGADGKTEVLRDDDAEIWFGGEVVILVDGGSASASEILAAALQDYGRAVIVGTGPTHGKGTVQVLLDLNRFGSKNMPGALGTLKLTRSQFFRINGGSTQWRGVIPDVVLPDPSAHIESGERHLDNSIPWSKVEPLRYDIWTGSKWSLEQLVANSNTRQSGNEAFTLIAKRNEILAARSDVSVYPLQKSAWIERRDRDREQLEAVTPELSDGSARFSVTSVSYGDAKPAEGGTRDAAKVAAAREKRWSDDLARDPWVEEALNVLGEMLSAR